MRTPLAIPLHNETFQRKELAAAVHFRPCKSFAPTREMSLKEGRAAG
jgi:hypothetical protein